MESAVFLLFSDSLLFPRCAAIRYCSPVVHRPCRMSVTRISARRILCLRRPARLGIFQRCVMDIGVFYDPSQGCVMDTLFVMTHI